MAKVILLAPEVYNQIAAGEVIENPASVVKELIENSLDAGASKIKIEITRAGKREIKVVDNGEGMTEEDLSLAIKKHATSKIKDMKDLQKIVSYGFRGEALPSIISVSIVEIITKTEEMEAGVRFFIEEGGKKIYKNYVSHPVGTTVRVLNLFYNTPARKKYLKSDATELRHIKEVFLNFLLARYDVDLHLLIDKKNKEEFKATQDLLERINQIYTKEITKKLIPIKEEREGIKIYGYVSTPDLNRPTRSEQFLFLNKRPIHHRYFSFWIQQAYMDLIPKGRFPYAFVYIDMLPELIDVNVHPSKKEVRFQDEYFVSSLIIKSIKNALKLKEAIPVMNGDRFKPTELNQGKREFLSKATVRSDERRQPTFDEKVEHTLPKFYAYPGKIFSIFNTYIIYAEKESILIIDQHAAHERIIFERLKKVISEGKIEIQKLLMPVIISLSPEEIEIIKEKEELLKKLGYEIEEFGGNTIILRGIPAYIRRTDDRELFLDIIALIKEKHALKPYELIEEILKQMACKSAVKAGDPLTVPEMENIVSHILKETEIFFCPHGRPVVIKLTKKEFEKMFHRS